MTCHTGDTLQQEIIALGHLSVFVWLIASRHVPLQLRIVGSASPLAGVVYYALLAAACESPWVSTTLGAYWHGNSLARLRPMFTFAWVLTLCLIASWCTIQGSGRFKETKLAALSVPVLASAFLVWRASSGIKGVGEKCTAVNAAGAALSWLVIHAATGSRLAMTRCAFFICGLMVSAGLLRKAYSLGLDGRVMPHTAQDAIHPHWAAPLIFLLMNSVVLITHAAAVHAAMGLARPQSSPSLSPLASSLVKTTTALPMQHILPIMISVAALVAMLQPPSYSISGPWHGPARKLFSLHSSQEGGVWLAGAGVAAVCLVLVVHHGTRRPCNPQMPKQEPVEPHQTVSSLSHTSWHRHGLAKTLQHSECPAEVCDQDLHWHHREPDVYKPDSAGQSSYSVIQTTSPDWSMP